MSCIFPLGCAVRRPPPRALAAAAPREHIALIVLNDHEEVGSASTTGAQGPFLESVLSRLVAARGGSADDLARSLVSSSCVSLVSRISLFGRTLWPGVLGKVNEFNTLPRRGFSLRKQGGSPSVGGRTWRRLFSKLTFCVCLATCKESSMGV